MDSSNPFDAPLDDLDRAELLAERPWVSYARYALIFCGLMYIVFGLALAPMAMFGMLLDPEVPSAFGPALGVVFGGMILVMCVGVGAANLIAAAGLKRGKKWAWIAAVILGGMYAPSGCLPFGVVILYGMLKDDVRKVFLG